MSLADNHNGKSRRFPDFVHVGPPRTGTTWLHQVLNGHIPLPRVKETHYFEGRCVIDVSRYLDLYDRVPAALPLGEFGPTYFANNHAREQIRRENPECKIICTFRDPPARLYSIYRLIRAGRSPVHRTFDGYWRFLMDCGYNLCNYADQLQQWQRVFGEDRVLPMFYQDLDSHPQDYLHGFCDFIGAPPLELHKTDVGESKVYSTWTSSRANSISRYAVVAVYWLGRHRGRALTQLGRNSRLRQALRDMFVEDFEPLTESSVDRIREIALPQIEALERMTGRDLSSWKPGARGKVARIERNGEASKAQPARPAQRG
jgi:Sulfotransferase domain